MDVDVNRGDGSPPLPSPPSPERARRRPSTSLPSIHHLHPEPLTSTPTLSGQPAHHRHTQYHQASQQQQPPFANYLSNPPPRAIPPHIPIQVAHASQAQSTQANTGTDAGQSATSPSSIPEESLSVGGDYSDPEPDQEMTMLVDEQQIGMRPPPPKKRRRQALSCTECKRRKIKCDRAHPCGPCQHKGKEDRCQWRVVEPVEKHVTRTEWEDMRARCRSLEERCARMEALLVDVHERVRGSGPGEGVGGIQGGLQLSVSSSIGGGGVEGRTNTRIVDTTDAHPSGLPPSSPLTHPLHNVGGLPSHIASLMSSSIPTGTSNHHSSPTQQANLKTSPLTPSLRSFGEEGDQLRSPLRSESTTIGDFISSTSPRNVSARPGHGQQLPPSSLTSRAAYSPAVQHQLQQERHHSSQRPRMGSNANLRMNEALANSFNVGGSERRRGNEQIIPPLLPTIRTLSLSHSFSADGVAGGPPFLPPLPHPFSTSTTSNNQLPYHARSHEQFLCEGTLPIPITTSLLSPPKTGSRSVAANAGGGAGGLAGWPSSRPVFSLPPLPPLCPPSSSSAQTRDGLYRLPLPSSSFHAQALFDDSMYQRTVIPSSPSSTVAAPPTPTSSSSITHAGVIAYASTNGVCTPPYTPEAPSTRRLFLNESLGQHSSPHLRDADLKEAIEVGVIGSSLTLLLPSQQPVYEAPMLSLQERYNRGL